MAGHSGPEVDPEAVRKASRAGRRTGSPLEKRASFGAQNAPAAFLDSRQIPCQQHAYQGLMNCDLKSCSRNQA
jgi:hypothetical protein